MTNHRHDCSEQLERELTVQPNSATRTTRVRVDSGTTRAHMLSPGTLETGAGPQTDHTMWFQDCSASGRARVWSMRAAGDRCIMELVRGAYGKRRDLEQRR